MIGQYQCMRHQLVGAIEPATTIVIHQTYQPTLGTKNEYCAVKNGPAGSQSTSKAQISVTFGAGSPACIVQFGLPTNPTIVRTTTSMVTGQPHSINAANKRTTRTQQATLISHARQPPNSLKNVRARHSPNSFINSRCSFIAAPVDSLLDGQNSTWTWNESSGTSVDEHGDNADADTDDAATLAIAFADNDSTLERLFNSNNTAATNNLSSAFGIV